jgi:Domain of unknown function (DUF5047)
MWPVTEAFRTAVAGSHQRATQVDVLYQGEVIAANLPVASGQVTMDSGRAHRSSCGLTFYPDGLIPTTSTDTLYPAANEIAVHSGVRLGNDTEMVPLGVYGFEDLEVGEDANGITLTVAGTDRAAKASRSLLLEPIVIARDTEPAEAIQDLLSTIDSLPGLIDNGSSTLDPAWLMPLAVYQPGADPWALALNVATAFGLQLFINREGVPVLDAIPDPDNATLARSYDVDGGAPVVRTNRTISTVNTYNGVVASGEGTDLVRPLQATAWDADPASPFYYEGPYGKKPYFYSSPLILTLDQAGAAARAKLKQVMGGIEVLTWDAVPDPALDVYDVVYAKREATGIDDNFVVESITIPLSAADTMTCSGRTSIVATEVDL